MKPDDVARPSLCAVVLAAGEGTRMRSATPKVLHPLCGRAMVLHVVDALAELPIQRIVVVVGHRADAVTKLVHEQAHAEVPVEPVVQPVQRGTGDAIAVALTAFPDDAGFGGDLDAEDDLVVLPGDTPLLRPATLAALLEAHQAAGAAATVLTASIDDPLGYGRIIRDRKGRLDRIVEHRDANEDERAVREINTGIYVFRRSLLAPALRRIQPINAQGEYYLTDAIAVLRQAGHQVEAMLVDDPSEAMGVNDRIQLAAAEAVLRRRINARWMQAGVTMIDPERTYIDASVVIGRDTRLLPGTILEGRTVVGDLATIGPDTRIIDSVVGDGATITYAVLNGADIAEGATVGPYASLRPGTILGAGAKIGTFVETKNADVRPGAKVPHLAYVGDAEIGEDANLGAGTITANYDGRNKHRTKVGQRAHTGSNTVLVAPVELGDDATTGAGAVVVRDVPPGALAKGVPAKVVEGWHETREGAPDHGSHGAAE